MRKLLKFPNGKEVVSEGLYVYDNADDPVEEIDLNFLSEEDYLKLKKNIKDKKVRDFIDKAKKKV